MPCTYPIECKTVCWFTLDLSILVWCTMHHAWYTIYIVWPRLNRAATWIFFLISWRSSVTASPQTRSCRTPTSFLSLHGHRTTMVCIDVFACVWIHALLTQSFHIFARGGACQGEHALLLKSTFDLGSGSICFLIFRWLEYGWPCGAGMANMHGSWYHDVEKLIIHVHMHMYIL